MLLEGIINDSFTPLTPLDLVSSLVVGISLVLLCVKKKKKSTRKSASRSSRDDSLNRRPKTFKSLSTQLNYKQPSLENLTKGDEPIKTEKTQQTETLDDRGRIIPEINVTPPRFRRCRDDEWDFLFPVGSDPLGSLHLEESVKDRRSDRSMTDSEAQNSIKATEETMRNQPSIRMTTERSSERSTKEPDSVSALSSATDSIRGPASVRAFKTREDLDSFRQVRTARDRTERSTKEGEPADFIFPPSPVSSARLPDD